MRDVGSKTEALVYVYIQRNIRSWLMTLCVTEDCTVLINIVKYWRSVTTPSSITDGSANSSRFVIVTAARLHDMTPLMPTQHYRDSNYTACCLTCADKDPRLVNQTVLRSWHVFGCGQKYDRTAQYERTRASALWVLKSVCVLVLHSIWAGRERQRKMERTGPENRVSGSESGAWKDTVERSGRSRERSGDRGYIKRCERWAEISTAPACSHMLWTLVFEQDLRGERRFDKSV